jgi:hypothetical protein
LAIHGFGPKTDCAVGGGAGAGVVEVVDGVVLVANSDRKSDAPVSVEVPAVLEVPAAVERSVAASFDRVVLRTGCVTGLNEEVT